MDVHTGLGWRQLRPGLGLGFSIRGGKRSSVVPEQLLTRADGFEVWVGERRMEPK